VGKKDEMKKEPPCPWGKINNIVYKKGKNTLIIGVKQLKNPDAGKGGNELTIFPSPSKPTITTCDTGTTRNLTVVQRRDPGPVQQMGAVVEKCNVGKKENDFGARGN